MLAVVAVQLMLAVRQAQVAQVGEALAQLITRPLRQEWLTLVVVVAAADLT